MASRKKKEAAVPSSGKGERLLPLLACAGGLLLVFSPILIARGSWVPGTLGDARLQIYLLEHTWRWLTGAAAHASLWNPPFFHPAPNVAAYSDLDLGLAPAFWLLRLAAIEPDSAFKAWLAAMFALNFVSGWALLRRGLGLPARAAAAGAFLFAFGSARVGQLEHGQMIGQFYTAFAVLALVRAYRSERAEPKWVLAFYACLAAQLYSAFYYAWFLGFSLGLLGLWALAFAETRAGLLAALRRNALWLGVGAAACALVLAPLVSRYLAAAREVGLREYRHVVDMLPRPQSWLYMGWGNWAYKWMNRFELFRALPARTEQALGLGLATSACCLLGLWSQRQNPWARALALAVLSVGLACTLLPGGLSLWRGVYALVPGAAALRAVARAGVFMLLPASVFFAWSFAAPRRGALLLGLFLICAAEQRWFNYFVFDQEAARRDAAAVAARIPEDCEAFLYVPYQGGSEAPPWWKFQLDAMSASLLRGMPTVNGYSGNYPPGYEPLNDIVVRSKADEDRVTDGLTAWLSARKDSRRVCVVKGPAS